MSVSTVDYLARLGAWALGLCLAEGVLLTVSWLLWSRLLARASAGLRHRAACAHFAGFIVLPALSLIALNWTLVRAGGERPNFPLAPRHVVPQDGLLATLMPLVGLVWMAGAAIGAVRLIRAWRETTASRGVRAPAEVVATVTRLAQTLGLRRLPAIAIADVGAPQVTGWRRPVIWLPADIAARLSPAELEAILLHELAHVRHGDYGWNLLQQGLLVLAWFHPGAWFVHARLRCERELRCDALAARRGRSGADLAMALVRLAETWPRPRAGLALCAAAGELTTRVTRLIEPAPAQRPWLAALPAAAAIGLCMLAISVGVAGRTDPGLRELYRASAFGPGVLIQAHDAAGAFRLHIHNGRVLTALLGPRALPARIVQRGPTATLIDRAGGPAVAVTVTPRGGIQWQARPPSPAA
jgi:beta-lactamase regulating signal transducer with metallopeptidase domain